MEILWLLRVTQKRMHTIRNDSMKYDRHDEQKGGRGTMGLYTQAEAVHGTGMHGCASE
jgi:hypothetical protein